MIADDTIAAISTPPGRGGIGIVRVSGPEAVPIAAMLFRSEPARSFEVPSRAYPGFLVSSSGERLDQCVAIYFRSPSSYTGEDIVELCCHGSPVILGQVLELLLKNGARLAEPGEFTLRAFFNHRMDLTQAQAVRDLIDAQTLFQARVAMRQLEGSMAVSLAPVKQLLIDAIVQIESSIEFVEDDILLETRMTLVRNMRAALDPLAKLERTFSIGKLVREGFDLAIIGRPNVGKSSVFNRLIGSDRAIVTEVPGTTRDTLHEQVSIRGVPVRLIDTAGIREAADPVERIGIERSRRAMADADVSLLILDGSQPLTQDDLTLIERAPAESRLVLVNKCDLPFAADGLLPKEIVPEAVGISALTGEGFDFLTQALFDRLGAQGQFSGQEGAIVTDARQHQALEKTLRLLSDAIQLVESGELEEIVLLRLRGALSAIGELTGETLTEDILAQIFSTFCIGK